MMIDSKMTTRVSTCYFLGSIKMKSIENGMVQIMDYYHAAINKKKICAKMEKCPRYIT